MAIEITFVRHAQSESNLSGRWQGQGNSRLSEEGRRQAAALGRRLAGARFDRLLCSDLTRCCDTAAALGVPVERDEQWREVDVGCWEGLTRDEVSERFPDEVRRLWAGASDVPIGGGESWEDLHRRVDRAFGVLCSRLAPGERALVVTHGGVIHGLLSGLLGLRDHRPRPIGRIANTAVSTVRVHADRPDAVELVTYNDVSHLGPDHPWAVERLQAGDTVVSLIAMGVSQAATETPSAAEGADIARLAASYPAVDHLYAGSEAAHRSAAAALAEAVQSCGPADQGALLRDDPVDGDDLRAVVDALAHRHGGQRIGLVASSRQVAGWAHALLGSSPEVAPPRHGAVAHAVTGSHGQALAAYNVLRRD